MKALAPIKNLTKRLGLSDLEKEDDEILQQNQFFEHILIREPLSGVVRYLTWMSSRKQNTIIREEKSSSTKQCYMHLRHFKWYNCICAWQYKTTMKIKANRWINCSLNLCSTGHASIKLVNTRRLSSATAENLTSICFRIPQCGNPIEFLMTSWIYENRKQELLRSNDHLTS